MTWLGFGGLGLIALSVWMMVTHRFANAAEGAFLIAAWTFGIMLVIADHLA